VFPGFAESVLPSALFLLGVGFLAANLRLASRCLHYWRIRSTAVLTWRAGRPSAYGVSLGFGVLFGVLVFIKIVIQSRPLANAFGEGMMFIYYAYAFPLSLRIGRGFYDGGVWSDAGFVPYSQIGGLSWREGRTLTLVLIDRVRRLARRLEVPQEHYGAVRRLLRDKIANHELEFTGTGVDLGADARDVV